MTEIEIGDVTACGFAETETGAVEQLEDRAIPLTDWGAGKRLRH